MKHVQNINDLGDFISKKYPELRGGRGHAIVKEIFNAISESLAGQCEEGVEEAVFRAVGFGNIVAKKRAARIAKDPRNGSPVHVGVRYSVRWTPSRQLKDRLKLKEIANEQAAQLETGDPASPQEP